MIRVAMLASALALFTFSAPASAAPKRPAAPLKLRGPSKAPPPAAAPAPTPAPAAAAAAALASTITASPAAPSATATPTAPAPAPVPAPAAPAPAPAPAPTTQPVDADVTTHTTPPAPIAPLDVSFDGGMVFMSQTFHSNADSRPGRLADYAYSAQGVAAGLGVRRAWSIGSTFRLGLAGFYRFAGLTGISTPSYAADGTRTNVRLGLSTHQAAGGVTAGIKRDAFGGIAIDAVVGPALIANYVEADERAPLPSDRTIGLLTGLRIVTPALAVVGGRPLGLVLEGSFIGLASGQDQTPNLEDGSSSSSRTLLAGAELGYGLFGAGTETQLALTGGYHMSLQNTSYAGASARNTLPSGGATEGERIQTMHIASLGVRLTH